MAWDTERTKQLLLGAATSEFSAHGLAGARVDRIAAAAGVNKERIYQYFGNKEKLFGVVLTTELTRVTGMVHVEGAGVAAVVDYAERLFDYHCADATYSRLMFWEGLELGSPVAAAVRREHTLDRVAAIRAAVPALTEAAARQLLQTIVTLCVTWQVLPDLDGPPAAAADRVRRRRDVIGSTVRGTVAHLLGSGPP